jgi:CheY-like chemotaxis protein
VKAILLLGSDVSLLQTMRFCLEPEKSYTIHFATSLQQLVEDYTRSNGQIDLVIADWNWKPSVGGLDVALNLRALIPKLKILVTAGSSTPQLSARQRIAIQKAPAGTIAFLRKPFSPLSLLSSVDELIGVGAGVRNRRAPNRVLSSQGLSAAVR